MAGKDVGENITLPEHKYVQIVYHGCLWKANEIVFNLLEQFLTLHVRERSFSHVSDQQKAIKT